MTDDSPMFVIAAGIEKALLVEVNGGELEHISTVYRTEGQAIVLAAAAMDAIAAAGMAVVHRMGAE